MTACCARLTKSDTSGIAPPLVAWTCAGDIMAVNLKNLDFSLLSEFLVGTGDLLVFYAGLQPATGLHDRRNDDVSVGQVERIGI